MKHVYALSLIFLILPFLGKAQYVDTITYGKSINKYILKNKLYAFDELERQFPKNETYKNIFSKYRQRKKFAQFFGYTSIGFIGYGLYDITSFNYNMYCDFYCGPAAGVLSIGVGFIVGTLALILNGTKKMERKTIDGYNKDVLKTIMHQSKRKYNIELAGTSNGVGIRLRF